MPMSTNSFFLIILDALSDEVTLVFVAITSLLFVVFVGIYIYFLIKYCCRINLVYDLIERIKTNKIYKILEQNEYTQDLYKALILYNGKFYLSQDIDYYINEKSLAPSILCSRLLPLVAALLTGIGVLGTFVGLLLGLKGLNPVSEAFPEEIKRVADGASVAFVTSVVGVFFSLVFNLFEKSVSARMAFRVRHLQNYFAEVFPPFPVMNVFLDMQKSSRDSYDILGGLADEIGNKMQSNITESVDKIADTIKQTLSDVLNPAISKMEEASRGFADRQITSSEGALKSVLSEFMDKVGLEGNAQREAIRSTTDEFKQTISKLSASMNEIIQSHACMKDTINTHIESTNAILEQGRALQSDINNSKERLNAFGEAIKSSSNNLASASESLESFSGNIRESMDSNSANVEKTTAFYRSLEEANRSTREKLEDILNGLDKLEKSLSEVAEKASQSVKESSGIAESYRKLQDNLREDVEKLDKQMTELLEDYGLQVKNQVSNRMSVWDVQTSNFCETMKESTQLISDIVEQISDVVDKVKEKLGNR